MRVLLRVSGGGSDSGPGHVVLGCYGVPFGGGGALFLRHSCTAFTGFFGAQTGRALPPCLLSFACTARSEAQRWRRAVWKKKKSAVQPFHIQTQKATKDPPLTPNSQAKSELGTDGTEAGTHTLTSHQCSSLLLPTNPLLLSPNPCQQIFSLIQEGNSQQVRLQTTNHPFQFSLKLPLSTFGFFSVVSLPQFHHFFGLTFGVLPQPTIWNIIFVHGFVFFG